MLRCRVVGVAFLVFPNLACVTRVVNFRTTGPGQVSVLESGKLDAPADPLGNTPLTVEVDKLAGKVVKITQPGAAPVYWVVSDLVAERTDANIAFVADGSASNNSDQDGAAGINSKATANRVVRLLLKSYQSLASKRFNEAKELAKQAAAIDPQVAGPHVIEGLVYFQEGKTPEARTALLKAKVLDPEDKDIDELLEVIQR